MEETVILEEVGFDSIMKLAFFSELEEELGKEIPQEDIMKIDAVKNLGELIEEVEKII